MSVFVAAILMLGCRGHSSPVGDKEHGLVLYAQALLSIQRVPRSSDRWTIHLYTTVLYKSGSLWEVYTHSRLLLVHCCPLRGHGPDATQSAHSSNMLHSSRLMSPTLIWPVGQTDQAADPVMRVYPQFLCVSVSRKPE